MSIYERAVREAVQAENARRAAEVRGTYTHKVFYKGSKERCYLESKAECERFAADVGSCRVVPASKAEIEAEAQRQERWFPGYR